MRCECCGVEGARLKCGRCRESVYCSAACQIRHWKDGHKAKCVPGTSGTSATPQLPTADPAESAAGAAQSAPQRAPIDVGSMSLRELKQLLDARGVDYSKCLEKSEIRALASLAAETEPAPRQARGDADCAICLDALLHPVKLPCGHRFCRDCIAGMRKYGIASAQVCPLCRAPMPDEKRILQEAATILMRCRKWARRGLPGAEERFLHWGAVLAPLGPSMRSEVERAVRMCRSILGNYDPLDLMQSPHAATPRLPGSGGPIGALAEIYVFEMMADGFGMLGDSEAMIAAYRECISCASFGKAPPMGQALVHCNLAVSLHKADEMDAASEHYSIASKLDPRTIEPRVNLVASMMSAHHYQKGIALCRSLIPCLQKRDQLKAIYTNLGVALLHTDDFAGAAEAHRMALSLDKRWALAHFNYAAALSALDDLDGAIREYSFVLRADPSDTEARGLVRELTARAASAPSAARAHESRGIALVDHTNFSGAIRELEAAIREEPDRISSFRELAKAYRARADARKGYFGPGRKSLRSALTIGEAEPLSVDPQAVEADRNAAMSMLFEAHKIDPHDANVIFDIAKVQMCGYSNSPDESTFNPSNAAEMLTKCVAENPEHPQAWQFLAQHYEARGDEDNVILACRNAVRANPRDSDSYYLLSNSLRQRSRSGVFDGPAGEVTREAMGTCIAAFVMCATVVRQYPEENRVCQFLHDPGAAARLAAVKSAPPILWHHAMAQFEHVGVGMGAEGGQGEAPPKPKQRRNTKNKKNKKSKKKT